MRSRWLSYSSCGVDFAGSRFELALPVLGLLLLAGCVGPASTPAPRQPVYPGFDTSLYPGDDTARRWRAAVGPFARHDNRPTRSAGEVAR